MLDAYVLETELARLGEEIRQRLDEIEKLNGRLFVISVRLDGQTNKPGMELEYTIRALCDHSSEVKGTSLDAVIDEFCHRYGFVTRQSVKRLEPPRKIGNSGVHDGNVIPI